MNNKKTDPTKTVLTISVGFAAIYLIGLARYTEDWRWALLTALGVGIIGIFSGYLSRIIDFLWMKLAYVLSLIIPNILLSIIFYLFLFPVALLSRIFGKKDPLFLKNPASSVFKETNKQFTKESFEKPW